MMRILLKSEVGDVEIELSCVNVAAVLITSKQMQTDYLFPKLRAMNLSYPQVTMNLKDYARVALFA